MKLLCVFVLAILGQVVLGKVSYRNYKVYTITPKNENALETLKNLENQAMEFSPFQFWHGPTKVGSDATLMVGPEMQPTIESMLENSDFDSRVMMDDVQQKIDNENRLWRSNVVNPVNWTVYNTLDEINNWLESLATEFPSYISILKPGKTQQGRDIVGVKLDFSPGTEKQVVFMESNIHAREWITSAVTTYILDEFLRSNATNITTLAQKYTWYFFPVMNPDGFAYSHEENRMWRKTRTRYNLLCFGADPNRNWGFQWMNGGASQNPCSDIYAGPHPFSEPSVDVMRKFIANITGNMVAYLNFHSFSQMLLLPYGHTTDPLDNYDEMMAIAEVAMEKLKAVHQTEYVYGNIAEIIYIASGASMDWVKGEFKVPIAYSYELRDKGQFGFLLPAEEILPTAEETLVSVISIFEEYEKLHPST